MSSEAGEVRWGVRDAVGGFVAALVLSAVVGGSIFAAGGWKNSDEAPIWAIALAQIPFWAGLGGAAVFASYRRGRRSLVADFGLTVQRTDVPLGLVIGVAAQYLVSYVVTWPVLKLTGSSFDEYEKPARELADKADASSWWGIVLLVLVVVVGAPLFEELFYRGLLQRGVARLLSPLPTIVVVAVVFGASHLQLLQLPALVVFGLILSTLAWRFGRLGPGIWAHVGFNLTTVITLLWNRLT